MKIYERVPKDQYGIPLYRAPQREAADFDADDDPGPDSTEAIDMPLEETPGYLLGRLESLKDTYASSMPGGCRSHLRKAIRLLQGFIAPTTESRKLGESYSPSDLVGATPPLTVVSEFDSPSHSGTYNAGDLKTFANNLRL